MVYLQKSNVLKMDQAIIIILSSELAEKFEGQFNCFRESTEK